MVAIDSDPGRCSRLLVMIEISTKYGLPTVLLYLNSNYITTQSPSYNPPGELHEVNMETRPACCHQFESSLLHVAGTRVSTASESPPSAPMSYQQLNYSAVSAEQLEGQSPSRTRLASGPASPSSAANRGSFLLFLMAVTYFTVIASLLLALSLFVNILAALIGDALLVLTAPTPYIIQLYLIIFCGACAYCEMEWTEIVRSLQILQNWIARGLFYLFIGLTAQETNSKVSSTIVL
jgi:hypothetical protein